MTLPPQAAARRQGMWRRWHRWLGLLLALPLAWALVSGTLLALWNPTRPPDAPRPDPQWSDQQGYARPAALQQLVQHIDQRLGGTPRLTLRPPRAAHEPILVRVAAGHWRGIVLADAVSGEPYDWRPADADLGHLLLELHHSLLLGDAAGHVLSACAAAGLMLVLLGAVLALSPAGARAAGLRRGDARWHRRIGLLLTLPLMLLLATGAWMGSRPLATWANALAGTPAEAAPKVQVLPQQPRVALLQAWQAAHSALPQGRVGYFIRPEPLTEALRVRMRLPDEPHPNGLSSVWLHPQTGEVLRVRRWHELDLGSRITNWAYPLHSTWWLPRLQTPLWLLLGALGLVLLLTGLRPWWRRRFNTLHPPSDRRIERRLAP